MGVLVHSLLRWPASPAEFVLKEHRLVGRRHLKFQTSRPPTPPIPRLEKRFEAEAATRNENLLAGGVTPNIGIWVEEPHGEFGNSNAVYGTPDHLFSPTSSVTVSCGVGR